MTEENKLITIPVLPLRGLVIFPEMMLHFDVGRKKSIFAINKAMSSDQQIFLSTQKDPSENDPDFKDIFSIGVVAKIHQVVKQPDNMVRIVVEGISRAKIVNPISEKNCLSAEIEIINKIEPLKTAGEVALVRSVKQLFEEYARFNPKIPSDILFKIGLAETADIITDYIAGNIFTEYANKQALLEIIDPIKRIENLIDLLTNEIYILKIESRINEKARKSIDENQRDYFLREQMRVIQEELGEYDDINDEIDGFRDTIIKLNASDEIKETLLKECDKLSKMPFGSHEGNVVRNYIELCCELPWGKLTKEVINIEKARKILNKYHYGLDKVKERILEQLAVKYLAPENKANILCLVGPPGVGKTSIAQSVAVALKRKCERISLGGVHDEAEIRGHRKTYVGAMPGRIISAIKHSKTSNPIIILDEIDKLANDSRGDPTSALLEVLDPEQNSTFYDHYVDLPFDLSKVMFITTANDKYSIPEPLFDRMDVIEIGSYTRVEKFHIAKEHLIPKQMKNCGINAKMFKISDEAVYMLIDNYTRESGVRSLDRKIAEVLRKSALKIVDGIANKIVVTEKNLEEVIGPKKYLNDEAQKLDEIGVVTGLAWTSVGGETLPIEVAVMNGTGKLELTGSLGDVMQESAKIAVSCIRNHADELNINDSFYKDMDIHIHAPEGAVPKDGPSAGITMATAIYSVLSRKPVKHNVAMTGEITLRGKVLPIGGLKEKSMAAYRLGIKTVIIPKDNYPDLYEVDPVVKSQIDFIPVETFADVLKIAIQSDENQQMKKDSSAFIPKKDGINAPAIITQ
ncbi:MAG: endopeptidase La [Bacillota bacterium]|nr:endopeptidase La [Bacillota bacterium]